MIATTTINNYTISIDEDYVVTVVHTIGNDDILLHQEPFTVFTNALSYYDKLAELALTERLETLFDKNE
jgi:hypothetical protein